MALRLPTFLRRGGLRPQRQPRFRTTYAPRRNGRPDPGEVVWAWVPFEEDASKGKDRPILVVGCTDQQLVGLPLTSKDHDRDADQEARAGRFWMDVGTGDWDRQRRPSEVRLNRFVVLDATAVRREGDAMPREMFDSVIAAATPYLPARQPLDDTQA